MLALFALALAAQEEFFRTEVPPHVYDLILGRPEARSVTASVLAYQDLEGYFEIGGKRTAAAPFSKGEPAVITLDRLEPDTHYTYRLRYRMPGAAAFGRSPEYAFRTQRSTGAAFTFAVQADSHLDQNTGTGLYVQTLKNIAATNPDFLIDLGDTFMTDKRRDNFRDTLPQYLAQRYYFGLVCHSVPLFLVTGNHDGETGARGEMAAWSHRMRTRYFPNPRTDGGPNYFAWQWGGALFIALDPYSPTTRRSRTDNWHWTLGEDQYRWLTRTLEASGARLKFVFIHHPVGGKGQPIRGGIEAAKYNEWGGRNPDGSDGFAEHRPGWAMPIHALLVKHGVSVVFHGHDHMYAQEELDGVVYQLVPQPGLRRRGAPRNAAEYGYKEVLGGAGFVRVDVDGSRFTIRYEETR